MKQFLSLLTLALFLCFGTFASAQVPSYVPTNGLVGWWPFNGNANDESGNSNHGTVNGATLAADRFGNAGKAYSFDRTNLANIETFSNNFPFSNANRTLSLWVSWSMIPLVNAAHIANYGIGNFERSFGLMVFTGNTWYSYSNGNFDLNSYVTATNSWTNLITTYENGTRRIYVNGVLKNSDTILLNTGSSRFFIGKADYSSPGVQNFFDGKIDDIAIYNRALTAQEVTNLYLGANVAAQEIQPSALQVYPNPANHEVTLQVLPHHLGKTVTVVNSLGQNVLQTQLQNERQTLSLEALPAGVYTAFLNDDRRTTVKLIKE